MYANDIILNYLKSTNCFNELFFAVDFIVVNTTGGILNALNNTTALTSSSFVSEHFLLRITITVIFVITWQTQYRKKTLGPNVQNQHNVLHEITTLRISTR